MFDSPYCRVQYLAEKNAILCQWKKFCTQEAYKEPLEYGLTLINTHQATHWITDTQHGFKSEKDDLEWLASIFTPKVLNSSCQNIVFIIQKDSPLIDEIKLHTEVLKHVFQVSCIQNIDELANSSAKTPVLNDTEQSHI